MSWWEDRAAYQATHRGEGGAWPSAHLGAASTASSRGGNAPNGGSEARGWVLTWRILFSGLELSRRPADGAQWGLAVAAHDRARDVTRAAAEAHCMGQPLRMALYSADGVHHRGHRFPVEHRGLERRQPSDADGVGRVDRA